MGTPGRGRKSNPDQWICGPDLLTREKYYGWLKHRAQARHRGEIYNLTWDDWQSLWTDGEWQRRGRGATDLCLSRHTPKDPWQIDTVSVITRREHFKNNKEFKRSVQ